MERQGVGGKQVAERHQLSKVRRVFILRTIRGCCKCRVMFVTEELLS